MSTVIRDPVAINRHLRSLRAFDRRTHDGPLRSVVDLILEMHQITVEAGTEDTWRDRAIPLRVCSLSSTPTADEGGSARSRLISATGSSWSNRGVRCASQPESRRLCGSVRRLS